MRVVFLLSIFDLQAAERGKVLGTFLGLSSMGQGAARAFKLPTRHLIVAYKSLWSRRNNSKAHTFDTFLPRCLHQELAS
jgi:hypothetical protein